MPYNSTKLLSDRFTREVYLSCGQLNELASEWVENIYRAYFLTDLLSSEIVGFVCVGGHSRSLQFITKDADLNYGCLNQLVSKQAQYACF